MAGIFLFAALVVCPCLVASGFSRTFQSHEVVAEIRIHGNLATSDEDVAKLAGVEIGMPVGPTTMADVTARLTAARRFHTVEVLKRYASIADPTRIVLVIIVDEGAVNIERTGDPGSPIRVVRRRGPNFLFLPLLSAEDGYGLIYGARFALPDPLGKNSRVSFPATWGGDKRAAVEVDKEFGRGLRGRLNGGASFSRRTHPFFKEDEDRGRMWARAEREVIHSVRVGATTGWQHVSLLGADDSFVHAGADIEMDTRLDPMLARNAVYARAAWEHFSFNDRGPGSRVNRTQLDGRGYVGLFGQSVLVVRALREDADGPLPAYAQPMLGGLANLRGFRAGTAVGDTLVAGSAELRLPLTSPLSLGKIGVSAFVDAGAVYRKGDRLEDQTLRRGVGASLWFSAAFVRVSVAVAHGIGASTRVHVGGTVSF